MPNYHCCAPECNSDARKHRNLVKYPWMAEVCFYSFPHKTRAAKARKLWIEKVRRGGEGDDFSVTTNTRICSRHFIDGKPTAENPFPTLFDYNNFKKPKRKRVTHTSTSAFRSLRADGPADAPSGVAAAPLPGAAAPTPPLGAAHRAECTAQGSRSRSVLCVPENVIPPVANEVEICSLPHPKRKRTLPSIPGEVPVGEIIHTPVVLHHEYSSLKQKLPEQPKLKSMSTQTDVTGTDMDNKDDELDELKKRFADKDSLLAELFLQKTLRSPKSVRTCYGLPNKEIFDGLFEVASTGVEKMKYWSGKHSSQPKKFEKEGTKRPGPDRKLSSYMEFAITLLQLRLGLLSFVLGSIFGVAESRISQIFTTWINHVYQTIVPTLVPWPSRSSIDRKMPLNFKKNFPKTRVIIDCSEFLTQTPRKPGTQHKTYSQYKSHNTFKILFGIAPNGAFTFVSDLWSGNVSDKYITRESGLIDLLEEGDVVMADRGFQIEDLLLPKKAKLVAPPFTRKCKYGKNKRLNVSEIKNTRLIANHRIYVEQAIGRLKEWKFFKGSLNIKRKAVANQAAKVAAAFCNIKRPLLK